MVTKTKVTFGSEATEKMIIGIDKVVTAVASTLGPDGQYTIISKENKQLHVTKDGFESAKAIVLEDQMEDAGAKFIQTAALKTVGEIGDGTTTTSVLAGSIIKEGLKNKAAGANPVKLKQGIEKATEMVLDYVNKKSKPVKGRYKEIATISANNDKFLGGLIGEALDAVTSEGIIRVEPSPNGKTFVEVVAGLEFNSGFLSPYLVNNKSTGRMEYSNVKFVLTEDVINSSREIRGLLKWHEETRIPIVIIAGDITGEAAATIVTNNIQNPNFNIGLVKAYGEGVERRDILEDIATITGATVLSKSLGRNLANAKEVDMGEADFIQTDRNKTTIIGGKGKESTINEKIEELRVIKDSVKASSSQSDRDNESYYGIRLGRMLGGVAMIKIGSASDVELKEKLDRLEDALFATTAATEKGVVTGGGVTLLNAKKSIDLSKFAKGDEATGANIVLRALEEPIRCMSENTGVNPDTIIEKIESNKDDSFGYNFKTREFGDLVKQGIIDPCKAETVALESASSAAVVMLTSKTLITDLK